MNKLTKRYSKQFTIILIFIIVVVLLSSLITKNQLKESLINTHLDKLSSLKHALKVNLEQYFNEKTNIIKTISNDTDIKNALTEFSNSFNNIENCKFQIDNKKFESYISNHIEKTTYGIPNSSDKKDIKNYITLNKKGKLLQCMYIINNPYNVEKKYLLLSSIQNNLYDKVHKKYHEKFIDISKRHNFYDIFLIDKNGDIIYSVFKELDLGTNLKTGIYKDSSLAKAYKKSLKNNSMSFSDFKPYEPSYNEPAAFFSIPLNKKNENIGAIAFQISIDEINNIMTFNKSWEDIGLGKTGESYLVGEDYLMRSDSRFLKSLNNEIVNKLNRTVGIINVKSEAVEQSLNHINASGIFKDYRDAEVLSSFTYINIFNNTWGLLVEIDINEISDEITKYINTILITGLIIILFTILLLLYLLKRFVVEPVDKYEAVLEEKVQKRTKKLNKLNNSLKEQVESQIYKIRQKDKVLLHQARMAAIGEMIGNIAHQWRQPLSIISTSISNIKVSNEMGIDVSKEELNDTTDKIIEQTDFLSKTIDDFRDFINEDTAKKENLNLKEVIKTSINLIEHGNEDIQFILFLEDEYYNCNKNHITQVLLNILKNSIDALRKKEDLKHKYIFISLSSNKKNKKISIKDNAGGISEEILDNLLDPYTTTKHKSIGTGLGLYMSYQIINNIYNGTIKSKNKEYEYNNENLLGAEFAIELPIIN